MRSRDQACEWCGCVLRIPQAVSIIADWGIFTMRTFHSSCLAEAEAARYIRFVEPEPSGRDTFTPGGG